MKFSLVSLALFASALAAPLNEKRQLFGGGLLGGLGGGGSTINDFTQGGCKSVIMVYARASTEQGNVGVLGAPLKKGLSAGLNGDFALQGVGPQGYSASLADNFKTGGSSSTSINTMKTLLEQVASKCPNAKILAGGYSQGTAVAARSIEKLAPAVRNRILGVVLFGYTQNKQLNGGVPGLPKDRVKVFCNPGDEVCTGTLNIKAAHFQYSGKPLNEAVQFLLSKVKN